MSSKTWVAARVPIKSIVLLHIITEKLSDIFSRFWSPDTSGIDAFMQSWKVENYLVVPLWKWTCFGPC